MLILLVHHDVWIRIFKTHCLRNLILLKGCCHQILKAVRVPLVLLVIDGEVLGHCIASVLVDNGGLVLGEPVDSVPPGLPVVLGQDILGVADLTGDVILNTRPTTGENKPSKL